MNLQDYIRARKQLRIPKDFLSNSMVALIRKREGEFVCPDLACLEYENQHPRAKKVMDKYLIKSGVL